MRVLDSVRSVVCCGGRADAVQAPRSIRHRAVGRARSPRWRKAARRGQDVYATGRTQQVRGDNSCRSNSKFPLNCPTSTPGAMKSRRRESGRQRLDLTATP